jgi:hypothetical protein
LPARGPTPAERVKAVGEQAYETATEAHASAAAAGIIAERARVEERRKILEENRGLTEAIEQQASAARANADKSQRADLDRRLKAIDEQYEQFGRKVADLRRRGVSDIGGVSLDDYELQLSRNKNDLKIAETVKFNKEQVALQNGVRNELAALIAAAGKTQKDDRDVQPDRPIDHRRRGGWRHHHRRPITGGSPGRRRCARGSNQAAGYDQVL